MDKGAFVYHVSGRRDFAGTRAAAAAAGLTERGGSGYRVVAYEDHLADLFAAADLVVGRAGASTVAELAVIGTPSIFVPLPGAPSDHQRRNAELLSAAGAAIVVDDDEATGGRLTTEASALLADPARLEAMGRAARRSRPTGGRRRRRGARPRSRRPAMERGARRRPREFGPARQEET